MVILCTEKFCSRSTDQNGWTSDWSVWMQFCGVLTVTNVVSVFPLIATEQSPDKAPPTYRELMLHGLLTATFAVTNSFKCLFFKSLKTLKSMKVSVNIYFLPLVA